MAKLLLAVLAFSFAASQAAAEIVYLKGGGIVAGSVVGATADSLDVQTPNGKLTFKKDEIAHVDYRVKEGPLGRGERLLFAGFGAGIPLKAQGFSRDAKADLAANVEAVYQVDEHWGLGLSFDAPGFATNYPSDDLFTRKSEVQAAGMEIVARIVGLPKSRVSPIVDFGAGFDSYSQIIETTSKATGALSETHAVVSGLAVVAGAGAQVLVGPRLIAQLETRWHYLQADKVKFGVDGAQAVSVIASVGCRF